MSDLSYCVRPAVVDTPPECWEKAFEDPEPEVYWAVGCYNAVLDRSEWFVLFTSEDDAARSLDTLVLRRPGECGHQAVQLPLRRAEQYARDKSLPGVRIMARDVDGWFVLKEVRV